MKSAKHLQQLKSKLQALTKLASKVKKYIIQVIDLEQVIENAIAAMLAPCVKHAPESNWDTQPYKVVLGNKVLFSAVSYTKCENFILWHTTQNTLNRFT